MKSYQHLDNSFGLVYRWQWCQWCEDDVTWLQDDDGAFYCEECWGLVGVAQSPMAAGSK